MKGKEKSPCVQVEGKHDEACIAMLNNFYADGAVSYNPFYHFSKGMSHHACVILPLFLFLVIVLAFHRADSGQCVSVSQSVNQSISQAVRAESQ